MVSQKVVEDQLKRAGCSFQLWGRSELRELRNILLENEEIKECLNGHYEGGFALLCATNQRILLVDHKPMFLTLEDIRYDMISEIDYSHRLLDATARIFTPTKSLVFTSWNRTHLRKLVMDAQQHVMAIRQYQQQVNSLHQQQIQTQQQPQVSTLPENSAELTPLTMPHPLEQVASSPPPQTPEPALSMMPLTSTEVPGPQPQSPFGTVMNPFLRSPLTTRHRNSWRGRQS